MDILNKVKAIAQLTDNEYITNAKKNGKKIIGYLCSYIPEEIITAAGMVPYRMRGVKSDGTEYADSFYAKTNCTYPRSIFNKMLKGQYDFLDGIVFMNSCDHMRRMYDLWAYAKQENSRFIHFIDVPHKKGDLYTQRYADLLQDFIRELEKAFNVTITDDNLQRAITLHNEKRRLINEILAMRRGRKISIKSSEFLDVMLSITAMPVEDAIDLLKDIINSIKDRDTAIPDGVRLMIAGGCLEDRNHIELIESLGGLIVVENNCLGVRYCQMNIAVENNPVKEIAKRYLEHLSCARMINNYQDRLAFIDTSRKDYNVDGVIFEKLTFCILYDGEMFMFRKEALKKNYPLLYIEREYIDKSVGQTKTRIQAFIEELKNNRISKVG